MQKLRLDASGGGRGKLRHRRENGGKRRSRGMIWREGLCLQHPGFLGRGGGVEKKTWGTMNATASKEGVSIASVHR